MYLLFRKKSFVFRYFVSIIENAMNYREKEITFLIGKIVILILISHGNIVQDGRY